jgi:hypothetical protein
MVTDDHRPRFSSRFAAENARSMTLVTLIPYTKGATGTDPDREITSRGHVSAN